MELRGQVGDAQRSLPWSAACVVPTRFDRTKGRSGGAVERSFGVPVHILTRGVGRDTSAVTPITAGAIPSRRLSVTSGKPTLGGNFINTIDLVAPGVVPVPGPYYRKSYYLSSEDGVST